MAGLCGPSFGSWAWTITSQLTGRQPARADRCDHLGQQPGAVEPLPARVGVGVMLADVAQAGRAEQGVGHRVADDVGVGMPDQAPRVVDPHAPQDQRPSLDQPVRVVTDPHPQGDPVHGVSDLKELSQSAPVLKSSSIASRNCRRCSAIPAGRAGSPGVSSRRVGVSSA